MPDVSLVNMRDYQWAGLVSDYRRLHWAGLLTPAYMEAARCKWGATRDEAQLAVYEVEEEA